MSMLNIKNKLILYKIFFYHCKKFLDSLETSIHFIPNKTFCNINSKCAKIFSKISLKLNLLIELLIMNFSYKVIIDENRKIFSEDDSIIMFILVIMSNKISPIKFWY